MIKPIKIVLSAYKSRFFPVKATWTINNVKYNAVFTSKEEATNYYKQRYLNVIIKEV